MDNRTTVYTRVASLREREVMWRNAVDAAVQHVKLGQTLQAQGIEILKSKQNSDLESMAKLVPQATATIEKGVKLERDARDKLIELYQQQPRDK